MGCDGGSVLVVGAKENRWGIEFEMLSCHFLERDMTKQNMDPI